MKEKIKEERTRRGLRGRGGEGEGGRTAESPQGRANRMLKPDFPKKGMGEGEEKKRRKKWEERKRK